MSTNSEALDTIEVEGFSVGLDRLRSKSVESTQVQVFGSLTEVACRG